jgi:UDP-glucose 4-epimerase
MSVKKILVTGAAGFIGSHLVDALLARGREVAGLDNFSTGQREFLAGALGHPRFHLVEGDLLNEAVLAEAVRDCETVFHFSANADVRFGLNDPSRDFVQNTQATFRLVEAMRAAGAKTIVFASSGSVYGETAQIPTPEDALFPVQTSLYGASKVAGEAMIQAYGEGYGFEGYIFRFVSVLGERYTHGHIFDFYHQLREHPGRLHVLGDGTQRKSYLHIGDCVEAVLKAWELGTARATPHRTAIYNLGVDDVCAVRDSVGWICGELGVTPQIEYGTEKRGWVGDNPFIHLDAARIRSLGWKPRLTIEESVRRTVRWLRENEWVFERRKS